MVEMLNQIIVVSCIVAVAFGQTDPNTKPQSAAVIKTQEINTSEDGSYRFNYESDNGISIAESGVGGVVVNGQASWISQEGVPLSITYVADENGYQPTGFHLPTPPPIPEAIARALKYVAEHPPKKDKFTVSSEKPTTAQDDEN